MSVFSVTALDRLIESDRRSDAGPAPTTTTPQKKQSSGPFKQRRPLYAAYPFASSASSPPPPAPPPQRSSSPTSFSPSPYVVNHKRRAPNGVVVDSQRVLAQRPESQKPASGEEKGGARLVKKEGSKSPQSSLTLHFRRAEKRSDGDGESAAEGEPRDANSGGGGGGGAAVGDKKGKGVAAAEGTEMRDDDPRGKKKVGGESGGPRQDNARGAQSPAGTSRTHPRTPSASSSEEWFDAPDGLHPDYSSDEDPLKCPLKDPGPSSRGDPDSNVLLQLKAEMQRRVLAEEAREALQQQRDGMARLLSSAGISVPLLGFGDAQVLDRDDDEDAKEVGVSASVSERLRVARCVAGAVATGAVRAEAEAELQTVLADKSREIARLKDKLQYYEVVTHEMSQRNQESIENARQSRRRRQRVQRLVVIGLGVAICVGASAVAVRHFTPWESDAKGRTSTGPTLSEGDRSNPTSLEQVLSRCKTLLSVKANTQLSMKHFPQ